MERDTQDIFMEKENFNVTHLYIFYSLKSMAWDATFIICSECTDGITENKRSCKLYIDWIGGSHYSQQILKIYHSGEKTDDVLINNKLMFLEVKID